MPYGDDALYEASQVETRWDEPVTPPEPEDANDSSDFDMGEFDCLEDALDALLEMGDE